MGVALALGLVGCTPANSVTPAPTASPSWHVFALPTVEGVNGCAGLALHDATLMGNPADGRLVWLQGEDIRLDIAWPPGYRARFVPGVEILNEQGVVVLRQGDPIEGACSLGDVLYVEPPFQ